MITNFNFEHQKNGACLITPFTAGDDRGEFTKDFNIDTLRANGIDFEVKEILNATSNKGVIRGLHFQTVNCQAKLLRCLKGRIIDVIVDLRDCSPTFGKYWMYEMSEEEKQSLYVPHGFAHGYIALEDDTYVQYFCDNIYNGKYDGGVNYLDPDINVQWPWDRIGGQDKAIVSDKDKALPSLKELMSRHSPYKYLYFNF